MIVKLADALHPLREQRRWVMWKREMVTRAGKTAWTKVPYTSDTRKAASDNPSTWRAFDKLQHGNGFAGPGLMLGDDLQGVDLDMCLDDDGVLEDWAAEIINGLNSYTEISPSNRGVKVLLYGPPGKSAEVSFGPAIEITTMEKKRREVAYFTGRRYFAITSRVWLDRPLRRISDGEAQWLREKIEAVRTTEKAKKAQAAVQPSAAPPRADHQRDLPPGLLRLLRDGAPEGERSEQFHRAVRWAADIGMTGDQISVLIEQYPSGIGAKYTGRVAQEVERCLQGWMPKAGRAPPPVPHPERMGAIAPAGPTDTLPLVAKFINSGGKLSADFADPVAAARVIVDTLYTDAGRRVLHYWQGEFHWWTRSHYVVLPMADVREMLYSAGPAVSAKPLKKRTVDDVLDALKAAANLSHRQVPAVPAWINHKASDPDPRAVIPLRNGMVHVDTGHLLDATPRLFVPYALPFDYTPDAAAPVEWFQFLASVWREDSESVDALQEWLGYLLTADTSQQKALMIVGPRRSGKGTIGRVIVQLLGERNVASPTLAALGNNFGLEPLIGKTAALMSDARLGSRADIAAVAENLLRLTGEDSISVDRKFREAYTAKLLARVVVLTNEVPVFRDAASALPSRFIILRTDCSFYGKEDHSLDGKLAAELPGILVWALAGLRRLRERGRFVQPAAGAAQMRLMEDLASPISAFVRDTCIVEQGAQVPVPKLYEAWRDWCKEHGRDQPGTEQTFGRDIAAAVPGVGHSRPRINGARVRMYVGVRLRAPDDAIEDDDDADDR